MAGKKSFSKGMDSLLGGTNDSTKKLGRPKVNTREITKTSQSGTKAGETRATFIMNEDQLEKVKAIAYWDRVSIKDVLSQAIDDYLDKKKSDLTKALNAYKGRAKE
jgi:hypothetical protein